MKLEPLFLRIDRVAGGRSVEYTIAPEMRSHPRTRRTFVAILWLLAAELVLGAAAVVVAVVLFLGGAEILTSVWMRTFVVLAMTLTLLYFAWRAQMGFYWAYLRLRLFSKIFPVITLVLAAIPGLYPLWMVSEQILFSLIMIGVGDYLSSDHMREAFPRPPRVPKPPRPAKPAR